MLRLVRDTDRDAERGPGGFDAGAVASEDRSQRFSLLHPITGFGRDHQANARIDHVFHLRAAPAHLDDRATDGPRLDTADESAARRGVDLDGARLRQQSRIVDDARIAALRGYDLLEAFRRGTGANVLLQPRR